MEDRKNMKKTLINIIINILGGIIVFAIFSFHEFLNWIVTSNINYHFFLMPWWGWGIIGFFAFEIVYFLVFIKRKTGSH